MNKSIKKLICSGLFLFIITVAVIFIAIERADIKSFEYTNIPGCVEHNDEIEFLFMENSDVALGNSEKLYVSFFNQDYAKNSSLTFHKEDCEAITVKPEFVNDEVALFDIPFCEKNDIGKYNFDRVSWDFPEAGYQNIDKSDKGYSFSVSPGEEFNSSDEAPVGIYNLDKDGNLTDDNLLNGAQTQMLLSNNAMYLDKPQNGLTICLDPGHGGNEPGAINNDLIEKNLNLRIAQSCRDELVKYSGVNVIMTRDGDWDVDLQERANIAKRNGANLFVSFHNNSGGGTGSEVWVQYAGCTWHNEFNAIGTDIGNLILDKLSKTMGLANRGVKTKIGEGRTYPDQSLGDYYAVLYWTRYYEIPGILIEHAFIDVDYDFLHQDENLVQMGRLDAQAIAQYYNLGGYGPSDILSGTYRIGSALNDNKVMQVQNKSVVDQASIVVSDDDSSDAQRWKVESEDNEWVTIQNVNSGKYLDVYSSRIYDRARLEQYKNNDSDNQKWKIIQCKGKYKILSKLSTRYAIDIPGSSLDPSNCLQMYGDNETTNQLFSFVIDIPGSDPDFANGYYRISSKTDANMVIDVPGSSLSDGINLQTYNKHTEWPNQIFYVEKVNNKYHKITNIVTNKVLDVKGSSTVVGSQLEQWSYEGSLNQLWSIKKQTDGKYCIFNACNGLVLDCRYGKASAGNAIDLYNLHGGSNQKWNFELYDEDIYKTMDRSAIRHKNDLLDGVYSIGSSINNNYVLDVNGGSKDDHANIQLYYNYETDNQKWEIKHDSVTGYATIVNKKSGKYLDVYSACKRETTNIDQYRGLDSRSQKWIIIKNSDSSYTIQSSLIPLYYITIGSDKPYDCCNVMMAYSKNSKIQNFYFNNAEHVVPPSDPAFNPGYYKVLSSLDNNLCVDLSGSNIDDYASFALWNSFDNFMNQQYEFIDCGDYHKIKNVVSDKYLTVESSTTQKNSVIQLSNSESPNQLWSIQFNNNSVFMINVGNGRVLSILGERATLGASIFTDINKESKSQIWNLVKVDNPYAKLDELAALNKNTISDGYYVINSLAGNNIVLDVSGGSMMPAANVQLYTSYLTSNQKWYIENAADNYVYIKNQKSGYYLDISGSKKNNNNNVCQYNLTKNPNQKWIIIKDGDGYKISSGLLLNLNLSSSLVPAYNETNVVVSYGSDKISQTFTFTQTQPTPPEPTTGTPIVNQPRTNVEKMMNYFNSTGHIYPTYYAEHNYGGNTLRDFCNIIVEESTFEEIDPAVVFCQAMKETGWLTFPGDVKIDQCNFCGLGATGGGNPGESFNDWGENSVRKGIRAQVQHLRRYAVGTLIRPGEPVDPRFYYPIPGCAPTVELLGGHWTPSLTYGTEIVAMMKNCY